MGGKKKSLANRLAKMSDEERARYLQRKADMEEEARRRKEQLLSTFMKNKIKREDGFSRLNLAKINQHWHHILRSEKCKSMKEEVEHLKEYITRIVNYKNRIINTLLEELEMAEMQYSHNFQSHSVHIDQMLESHQEHLSKLEKQFVQDRDELVSTMNQACRTIQNNSEREQIHLKTVIFGQSVNAANKSTSIRERYMEKKQDVISTYRIKLSELEKRGERHSGAIWRQIAQISMAHVQQTDTRRLHMAELNRVDAESATKIADDQERINAQEKQIEKLNNDLESLQQKRSEHIKCLEQEIAAQNQAFKNVRKQFRKEMRTDESKLTFLSQESDKTIKHLEKLHMKGNQIVNLSKTCSKIETEREQIEKWLQFITFDQSEQAELPEKIKPKPISAETLKKIVISTKSISSPTTEDPAICEEFNFVLAMEKFWHVYNKAHVELEELKHHKKMLQEENKKCTEIIRNVLEEALQANGNESYSEHSTTIRRKLKTAHEESNIFNLR